MDKKFKQQLFLVAFGIILFAILMNMNSVIKVLSKGLDIVFPILVGFLIAFVLNVPMRGLEHLIYKLTEKFKKKPKKSTVRLISILLIYVAIVLLIVLLVTLIIPTFIISILNIYNVFIEKLPVWTEYLKKYDINLEQIVTWFESLDIKEFVKNISVGVGSIITVIARFVSNIFSGIATFSVALIISVYTLLYKDDLLRQCDKLASAVLKENVHKKLKHIISLINNSYAKFLSGQCFEACILGVLMFIALKLFRIPYAGLIGLLAAIMSFVPYIGATFACLIGVFLVLLAAPKKAVLCLVVYLITQYIENQFIYPYVVGTSVGLSPLWTLIAVLIGGELFGLFGMIFFIPLMAVIFQLLKEYANKKSLNTEIITEKNKAESDSDSYEKIKDK